MPPTSAPQAQSTVPSQLLTAAVMAFRTLVQTVRSTGEPSNQLTQIANSLGDVATMFERIATSESTYEQQFNQIASNSAQVQQQINQQATINNQLNSNNQDTARELSNLRQAVQTLQAQAATGGQPGGNASRKPLCERRKTSRIGMRG